MKCNFRLRGLHFESGIPCASIRTIEPSPHRVGMRKRSVHDMCQAETGNQFHRADAGQPSTLAEQSVVGRTLKLNEIVQQIIVVFGEQVEDGLTPVAVTIWDKPVR